MKDDFPYKDIIDLPHHQTNDRKHMSLYDRAAQFAAFQALSGYEDMIYETGRLTDEYINLTDIAREELDRRFVFLSALIDEGFRPEITVTYFIPDNLKEGGSYAEYTGEVKMIDRIFMRILFYDGEKDITGKIINISNISAIEGEIFSQME